MPLDGKLYKKYSEPNLIYFILCVSDASSFSSYSRYVYYHYCCYL
jgi:hypothetical protein